MHVSAVQNFLALGSAVAGRFLVSVVEIDVALEVADQEIDCAHFRRWRQIHALLGMGDSDHRCEKQNAR